MELNQKFEEIVGDIRAISLHFVGELDKVDYVAADDRLGREMTRLGISYDMSDYFCVYPSDPSAYAGTSDDPDLECVVDVCITLPAEADYKPSGDFHITHIAQGKYLVFILKGPYDLIPQAYCEMYSHLLPQAMKTLTPDPSRPMMERYVNDPAQVAPEDLITEFWHPIL